jgi:hypothetical protein
MICAAVIDDAATLHWRRSHIGSESFHQNEYSLVIQFSLKNKHSLGDRMLAQSCLVPTPPMTATTRAKATKAAADASSTRFDHRVGFFGWFRLFAAWFGLNDDAFVFCVRCFILRSAAPVSFSLMKTFRQRQEQLAQCKPSSLLHRVSLTNSKSRCFHQQTPTRSNRRRRRRRHRASMRTRCRSVCPTPYCSRSTTYI